MTKIPWGDGTGGNIVLAYDGAGDGPLVISSDTPNPGADRERRITLRTANPGDKASVMLTVRQAGRRAPLNASDGVLRDNTDDIILVLK